MIAAARAVAHKLELWRRTAEVVRLVRAVVVMESLEQAAAERIKAEREQQEGA